MFVNKRIANNLRIPFLSRGVPDARFVSLVRDGRAVALSLSRVDWWADEQALVVRRHAARVGGGGGRPVGACARNWVRSSM